MLIGGTQYAGEIKKSVFTILNGRLPNRRMLTIGPFRASGGIMALKREPSGKRASTMGDDSLIRRPTRETIRWMISSN